jgi:hypothetical protein
VNGNFGLRGVDDFFFCHSYTPYPLCMIQKVCSPNAPSSRRGPAPFLAVLEMVIECASPPFLGNSEGVETTAYHVIILRDP